MSQARAVSDLVYGIDHGSKHSKDSFNLMSESVIARRRKRPPKVRFMIFSPLLSRLSYPATALTATTHGYLTVPASTVSVTFRRTSPQQDFVNTKAQVTRRYFFSASEECLSRRFGAHLVTTTGNLLLPRPARNERGEGYP